MQQSVQLPPHSPTTAATDLPQGLLARLFFWPIYPANMAPAGTGSSSNHHPPTTVAPLGDGL